MNRRVLFLSLPALAALAAIATWLIHASDPFKANFDRIEVGMGKQDVIQLVGIPDDEYDTFGGHEEMKDLIYRRGPRSYALIDLRKRDGDWIVGSKEYVQQSLWDRIHEWLFGRQELVA